MTDPLKPSLDVLVKLGSIMVHAEEFLSPSGHEVDRMALQQLLDDADVQAWRQQMDAMAMLPVKRS